MACGDYCCFCPSRLPGPLDRTRARWRSPVSAVPVKTQRTRKFIIVIIINTVIGTLSLLLLRHGRVVYKDVYR